MLHDRPGAVGADARRQEVGPELGTVEVAHVLVVRVENDAVAHPDAVAGARQETAAGAGVAADGGDGQLRVAAQDGLGEVVDGVDVGPGFVGRAVGGLDQVEVDAVRPEVAAAVEDDHPHRPRRRPAEGIGQPAAMRRAHRPVIEAEGQETDAVGLAPGDVLPGRMVGLPPAGKRRFRQFSRFREGDGRRQLDAARLLDVADPYRAVGGRAAQRRLAARQQRARGAAQAPFRPSIEQLTGLAEEFVGDAGKTVGGAQSGEDIGGGLRRPVDLAVGLADRWMRGTGHALRLEIAGGETLDRLQHGAHRRFGDFVAVERALARRAHGKFRRRPDRAGVHFRLGLQHGDAPARLAALDRPVERSRAAVAGNAGMDDEAGHNRPHRLGNRPLQEGRQHQVGAEAGNSLFRYRIGDVQLDADGVSTGGEFAEQSLGQAVEAMR